MGATEYRVQGGVAVITLNNPPVNGLGHALRSGDRRRPRQGATPMPAVKAIVLIGAGKAFSGGADIREFNTPKTAMEPTLHAVIDAIEDGGEAGGRGDRRRRAWAAASSSRSAATTASPRRARRSRCPR